MSSISGTVFPLDSSLCYSHIFFYFTSFSPISDFYTSIILCHSRTVFPLDSSLSHIFFHFYLFLSNFWFLYFYILFLNTSSKINPTSSNQSPSFKPNPGHSGKNSLSTNFAMLYIVHASNMLWCCCLAYSFATEFKDSH